MLYITGLIALTFFAVIGIASFITSAARECVRDDKMSLVLSGLSAADAEARVRRAVGICADIRCERLCCECADDEAAAICERLNADFGILIIEKADAKHPL